MYLLKFSFFLLGHGSQSCIIFRWSESKARIRYGQTSEGSSLRYSR